MNGISKNIFYSNFINSDFKVYYYEQSGDNVDENTTNMSADSFYRIKYVFKGKSEVLSSSKTYTGDETVFISKPDSSFLYRNIKGSDLKVIVIEIHPSVLNRLMQRMTLSADFLYDNHIICISSDPQFESLKALFYSLKRCVNESYSREELLCRVFCIFSELARFYSSDDPFEKSDNISLRIKIYVDKHFNEKITLEILEQNFFVSHSTIIKAFRLMTGKTFHDYLVDLRLREADKLLKRNVSAAKAAQMCGFNSYSTFYREYKKRRGKLPKECVQNTKDNWPVM